MTFLSNWALITVNTEDRCVILSTGILKCSAGVIIIIIIIMKIIYIAPTPLKGSRRFTKSVTATLQFT